MREFLHTKGFKMTAQRKLIFQSFYELGRHVSVDDVFDKVRSLDRSIGYSTVWRNLKLMCSVGLAQEVNLGDGVTRYDRLTRTPHGHLYCVECRRVMEFELDSVLEGLTVTAAKAEFAIESVHVELQGLCAGCKERGRSKAVLREKRATISRRRAS